jgi:hypothetical protein
VVFGLFFTPVVVEVLPGVLPGVLRVAIGKSPVRGRGIPRMLAATALTVRGRRLVDGHRRAFTGLRGRVAR